MPWSPGLPRGSSDRQPCEFALHESANAQGPRNELSARHHINLRAVVSGADGEAEGHQPRRPPQPPPAWLLQNTLVNYAFLDNRCVFWTTDWAGPVKCGDRAKPFIIPAPMIGGPAHLRQRFVCRCQRRKRPQPLTGHFVRDCTLLGTVVHAQALTISCWCCWCWCCCRYPERQPRIPN